MGSVAVFLAATVIFALAPTDTQGGCNIIPGTTKSFRGQLGTIDRPFAGRDTWVEINLGSPCHSTSPGFLADPADHNVTIAFKPPAGSSNLVVLSTDCAGLAADLTSCNEAPGVATVTCVDASTTLPPFDMDVLVRDGERNFRFRFPDTDALAAEPSDDVTLAGSAAIAVTAITDELPCHLASQTCAQVSDVIACVDEIYEDGGECTTVAHGMFSHFTALPPANSYQGLCTEPSPPCTGASEEVRFAVDQQGNILLPMDWRGVLIGEGLPIARLLRGASPVEAFTGSSATIVIPGDDFLSSLSPEGGVLPPVFDPQFSSPAPTSAVLFGSTDATDTVLRIARRSPDFTQCSAGVHDSLPCTASSDCPGGVCTTATCAGGQNDGQSCTSDSDCPSAECGASLFDFADRVEAGVGPVILRRQPDAASLEPGVCDSDLSQECSTDADCESGACVRYRGEALDPVPLTGMAQTDFASVFVVSEGDADTDLNGDGDTYDLVATFRGRSDGVLHPLGAPEGCATTGAALGRAVSMIQHPPFSLPAFEAFDDYLAVLESEADQNQCDRNSDGDTFDSILSVFRLGAGEAITEGLLPVRAVDPSPLVNQQPLAASAGRLFFRSSEVEGQFDYDGNGQVTDSILEVMELPSGSITTLCAATQVAASNGRSAFLRPESLHPSTGCAAGSLNGDGDTSDSVVQLWGGSGAPSNTGLAATAVSISNEWAAAVVSETAQAATDLNGDGDTADGVVFVHRLGDPSTAWESLGTSADTVHLAGDVLIMLTPETQQGGQDLNGDGDATDRVLQIYDLGSSQLINVGQSAEEFVAGGRSVGFRTRESEQSADLNGDADTADDIFQLFDYETRTLINTKQTVLPCDLEACDPTLPYRVLDNTARFLTSEPIDGQDLNGDGDSDDVVLRVFNIAMALDNPDLSTVVVTNGTRVFTGTMTFGNMVVPGLLTPLSSVPARRHNDVSGLAPALTNLDGAVAYVRAGRCVEVFEATCSPTSPCRSGEFCNTEGLCEREHGVCLSDDDCPPAVRCKSAVVAATAADTDSDELPDTFDNCPEVSNVLQRDLDKDGIGDACASRCGNGLRDSGEECDSGPSRDEHGQACRNDCKLSKCGDPFGLGQTSAASALYVLRSAVGLSSCASCVCDLDGTGNTSASDALRALHYAIGEATSLECPACTL